MKRLLTYLFLILGLTILFQSKSFAATITHDVDAEKAILIDFTSGKTLLEKNADQPIAPGSMTKIMTSVIAFDYLKKNKIKLSDKFFISEKAWRMSRSGYSAMFIMLNDKISVENLLKGIIIVNGNDASVALAEGIAGSEAKFVTLMNKKAKEIGLKKTNFANSTGMSDANNYSTVRDIAKLSAYLIKNYPKYYHYYKETKFTWNRTGGDAITQGNRNPLLYKNIGVDGLKTSFTTREGYALASSIKFRDKRLIAVGIGFKSKNSRSRESAKLFNWGLKNYAKFDIPKKEPTQTQQVAKKKEPKQTQETNKGSVIEICGVDQGYQEIILRRYPNLEKYKKSKTLKDICSKAVDESNNINLYKSLSAYISKKPMGYCECMRRIDYKSYNSITKKYGQPIRFDIVQFAKKEPKKKEKKVVKKEKKKEKKKVVKVVEQEQEEIKVKTKKLDTTGPEIEIAAAITVDDSQYIIEGEVSDKGSDKIYIKVEGQDIPVKRGKFKIVRYSPVDEEVKIVAIDKWGNKSTKVVKVTIDIQEEMVVQKLEPLNPGRAKGKTSGEKVALIIGIENYTEAPKANYANLDAKYFFDYARKAFGAKKQNIKLLINEDATYVKTNVALTKWLRNRIKADQTDLIVFFAGHGLASSDGKELYLLPQDSDPDLLDITALSRTKLFQTIVDLKPKSVTMFLDTCYSGVSRDEQMLLASARPIRIVAGDEGEIPNNFTIFSASGLDQISSGFKEAKHGIFSYYLMKGLEGKADANKNKEITNGELLAYMDLNVSQKALEQGRQQNPSLIGDPDQVLMRY